MLEVSSLTAGYGDVLAVRNVSLALGAGEVVALLGPNGAGKTTTLAALFGLVRVRAGRVVYDGQDVTGFGPRRLARIGCVLVPEGRGLFPSMTVDDHLRLAAFLIGRGALASRREFVFSVFPRLAERRAQPAGTMSGGEQQMLAVARGLMYKPRLLVIDEASLGLAPIVVGELYEALVQAIGEDGSSLLVVEQHAPVALQHADRLYVLESGRVALSGSAAELRDGERIRQAYFGEGSGEGNEMALSPAAGGIGRSSGTVGARRGRRGR